MYQTLIRPVITYGCPVWFNVSPAFMEILRIFERRCLRACTSLYRTAQSQYTKYVSNKKLYNKANVVRIDNFIINLIRNHILRCTTNYENNLIMAPYYTNENYISEALGKGFVPPEAFIYLDKNRYIQDINGIPVIYHIYRRANIKAVQSTTYNVGDFRFNTNISQKDIALASKTRKFWWLS